MKYKQQNNVQYTETRVNFDGTNPVKIDSIAGMTGLVLDSQATATASNVLKVEADFVLDVAKVYTNTFSAGATGTSAALPIVSNVATAGIFRIQDSLAGTLTIATESAKVTLTNAATVAAIPVGTALTFDGEGTGLQPVYYVQSKTGSDLVLGYSSAVAVAAKPVIINILGEMIKDKIIVDAKVTIAGPDSYFVASLPAKFINNQVNLISERQLNGVKLLINTSASSQKMFTITKVDVATGKYYFDGTDSKLKNNAVIKGQIHFQPGFSYVPAGIQEKSIYKEIMFAPDALQPGPALLKVTYVSLL